MDDAVNVSEVYCEVCRTRVKVCWPDRSIPAMNSMIQFDCPKGHVGHGVARAVWAGAAECPADAGKAKLPRQ